MSDISGFIPKKILVLQQRQLGDVIVATPIFSVLRENFPDAHISLFTENKCAPLLENDPNIDSLEILKKGKGSCFWQQWQLYYKIRQEKYDVVVDLQQLPRCQLVTLFSGATYKLTFTPRHKYRTMLYTHYGVPENFENYISYTKTEILSPLGIDASHKKPKLYVTEDEIVAAKEILYSAGIPKRSSFITLDATHKHPYRRWKHYAELVQKILIAYPKLYVFLLRAPGEEKQLEHLLEIEPKRICMPKIAPNLRESMACMSRASYHVGNTSAPAHMALALNIPALIILSHTANLWHFNPEYPEEGMAKQIEVRAHEGKLSVYYSLLEHGKDVNVVERENVFGNLENPELDLITVDNAFDAFELLVKSPYY